MDKVEEGDFPEENLGDKEVLETIFKNSDEATEEGMEDGLEDFLERFDPNKPLVDFEDDRVEEYIEGLASGNDRVFGE